MVGAMNKPRLKTLKPTLGALPARLQTITPGSWRTSGMTAAQRGYGYRWQKARESHLRMHPLCVMCDAQGRTVLATVVDHKTPHRGDQALFWDRENWQSLCSPCHDVTKRRQEAEEAAGGSP